MPREPFPAVAIAISFIDAINRQDLKVMSSLMSDGHELRVLDEPPVAGREANMDAWRGYFDLCPHYIIYPEQIGETADDAAILGYTTGSHLALPDDEERLLKVIWRAETTPDGRVAVWEFRDDSASLRTRLGFVG